MGKLIKLMKEYDREQTRKFKKTEKILKVMERIIYYARKENWSLDYLVGELEVDIKIWKEKYL